MASYSYTTTSSSIRISVSGLSSGDKVTYFCRLSTTSSADQIDHTASGSTDSATFSGLSSDTDYVINVRIGTSFLGSSNVTTDAPPKPKPTRFSWSSNVSEGSPVRLSATEWNSFLAHIATLRDYKGMSEYNYDTVSRGDPITATSINEAANMLYNWGATSPQKGWPIRASYLNGLVSLYNNAVNAL